MNKTTRILLTGITAFLLALLGMAVPAQAQDYPEVLPGDKYTNRTQDTMIVFTLQQAKTALKYKKFATINDSIIALQQDKIANLEQQITLRDEKIELYKQIIASHERVQLACEEHAHEMKTEARRQARLKNMTMIGAGVAIVLSILFL